MSCCGGMIRTRRADFEDARRGEFRESARSLWGRKGVGVMYAVVRRYTFDPKNAAEVNESVKEAFVPLLKEMPGFVAYYWLETGTGAGASLTVFENEAGAQ